MFAAPVRLGLDEFGRDEHAFDALTYLYLNEDVRAEIGFDQAGAWRHWTSVGHAQGRYPPGLDRVAPRTIDRTAMAARPLGLNVIGPFETISGLGTAARNLLAAIRQTGLPHDIHPFDVSTGHALITDAEFAAPLRYRFNLILANADQIRRVVGLYPDGAFNDAHTIAVWAWELATFRADWHAAFALVDEVWTNSRFELDAIAAVSPVPVHLIPLPIPDEPLPDRTSARALFALPADAWVALCAFDASSTEQRKNPFAAIRAFRDAFGLDPGRILIVKHHGGDQALGRRLREARAGAANIRLLSARLTPHDHLALRSACDAFLSAHRSEGFGLNLAEFLQAGRAVIATDYSGSRDFLDASTGHPVRADLVEVGTRTGPYLQHAIWAEPDGAALAASLREAADDQGNRPLAARARMESDFSIQAIAARIHSRLGAIDEPRSLPASLTGFVARGARNDRIAWPARLPMFALVTDRRGPPDPALLAQAYPFWELCAVLADPPPPEDMSARGACRGDDPRVRLLRSVAATPLAITAAEAASASWLVLTDNHQALTPNILLDVARALDREDAPDLLSSLDPAGSVVIRKSALLAAHEANRSLNDILARVAASGRVAHFCAHDPVAAEAPVLSPGEHVERITALGLFDREHYLVSFPDVSAAGTDPLLHYVEYGWREHRAPNFYFDPVWYRALNMLPEDADLDPLLHWERFRNSGVRPSRHFDPAWVRRANHLAPGIDPLRYFLERRCNEDVSPLPEFDPAWYRARRRDIAYRKVDPFEHYMRFGAAEGVNPSAEFDTRFYAARHMRGLGKRDPVASNPLLHYLENRDTQPAVTSLKAALRQEVARLRLLGRSFIEMSFCWFDGLPQRIDALRTYLADPTLPMPFLLVFANRLLETASRNAGDDRTAEACRLPLADDYDDPDICHRLAECFADPRCLRRGGKPILAIIQGDDRGLTSSFAQRLAVRLAADHDVDPSIELLD